MPGRHGKDRPYHMCKQIALLNKAISKDQKAPANQVGAFSVENANLVLQKMIFNAN